MSNLDNVNILSRSLLPTPREVKDEVALTPSAAETVSRSRRALEQILRGEDPRRFVVVGPCSIHDLDVAEDYANRLHALNQEVQDTFLLVMRVYFEKPRTTVGWKGFINDPYLDDSFHIEEGLVRSREFLLSLAEKGVGAGTEALDPITPQYLGDLICWNAIGARTTESQTHRELASGLSAPIGFKNGTDGNIGVAVNGIRSAARPHHFLGIDQDGTCAVFHTRGNSYSHVVLRGGREPNYTREHVAECEEILRKEELPLNIMVDCSHANSGKDHTRQPAVFEDCIAQIADGNRSIVGLMLESNIAAGRQDLPEDLSTLKYGVSVTDACMDWETTERLLRDAHRVLSR